MINPICAGKLQAGTEFDWMNKTCVLGEWIAAFKHLGAEKPQSHQLFGSGVQEHAWCRGESEGGLTDFPRKRPIAISFWREADAGAGGLTFLHGTRRLRTPA
jgi:hypothetical protein